MSLIIPRLVEVKRTHDGEPKRDNCAEEKLEGDAALVISKVLNQLIPLTRDIHMEGQLYCRVEQLERMSMTDLKAQDALFHKLATFQDKHMSIRDVRVDGELVPELSAFADQTMTIQELKGKLRRMDNYRFLLEHYIYSYCQIGSEIDVRTLNMNTPLLKSSQTTKYSYALMPTYGIQRLITPGLIGYADPTDENGLYKNHLLRVMHPNHLVRCYAVLEPPKVTYTGSTREYVHSRVAFDATCCIGIKVRINEYDKDPTTNQVSATHTTYETS